LSNLSALICFSGQGKKIFHIEIQAQQDKDLPERSLYILW
jgi:hypothetical protein